MSFYSLFIMKFTQLFLKIKFRKTNKNKLIIEKLIYKQLNNYLVMKFFQEMILKYVNLEYLFKYPLIKCIIIDFNTIENPEADFVKPLKNLPNS